MVVTLLALVIEEFEIEVLCLHVLYKDQLHPCRPLRFVKVFDKDYFLAYNK